MIVCTHVAPTTLDPTVFPLVWPQLAPLPLAAVLRRGHSGVRGSVPVMVEPPRSARADSRGARVITLDRFTFWYPGAAAPAARRSRRSQLDEGSFALVVGRTGSGKSTLLRALNGLVPHFTGGHVEGRVVTGGRDPRGRRRRASSRGRVGVVGQDPIAGFVTDTVEEELAYGMEQLADPPQVMRRRVEEILDRWGSRPAATRAPHTVGGRAAASGDRRGAHRVAAVLVLDEPTSALDPAAAEDALAVVRRLVHDLGITVVAAEHRLERVVEYADRLVLVDDQPGPCRRARRDDARCSLAPPVVAARPACRMGPTAALGARRPTAGRCACATARKASTHRGGGRSAPAASAAGGLERATVSWSATERARSCGGST